MAGHGVRFDLVLGNPNEEDDRAEKGLGDITSLDERTGGAVVSIEGLNEPDTSHACISSCSSGHRSSSRCTASPA